MSQANQKATSRSLTVDSSTNEVFQSSTAQQSHSISILPVAMDPQRLQSLSTSQTGSPYRMAPIFTKSLQNIRATKGQLVAFECRIQAMPTLQVRWYREYKQIMDSADFRILRKKACFSAVPEEVCTLIITEAFPEDSGVFKCIAENEFGTATSSAHLSVSQGANEMEELETLPHRPLLQATMKKALLPRRSQNVVKERDLSTKPSYNVLQKTPAPGKQGKRVNSEQHSQQSETDEFHGVYEDSSEASSACYSKPMYNKQASTKPKTSDREIQGTKEALIQDLERKLQGKDNFLHNGNQRLTYEERMARRLLGPENAASVLVTSNEENVQNSQQQNSENTRLQGPATPIRGRPSSRGEGTEHGSIQEKFFQPRFLQVPEDKMTIEEGRFCRIDFKVSGLPAPDLAWYLNGRLVYPDEFHKMIVSEKGVHSLIFEVVRGSDAGTYECVASNRAGEASFTVQLDVIAKEHQKAPTFIFKPQSKRVYEGDSARLECQISAIPTPRIYWKRNNEMLQYNTDRISLFYDNPGKICLLIHDVNKKDAGWYTVSAVNEAGVATCHCRLDVATHTYKPIPAPRQLKVRPTFSKYLAFSSKGLDVKPAFSPEGEFERLAAQSGLYESDEL
ncbi:myotilin isoform X4 [Carettochelys insculpta]|uniref:myotilin isoform X4 n=1 Tax=Carettochelys insculpta TaxID=44489 RepID=UPI003EB7DB89